MPRATQTVPQGGVEETEEVLEEADEAVEPAPEEPGVDNRSPGQRQLDELTAAGVPSARISIVTDSSGRILSAEKA